MKIESKNKAFKAIKSEAVKAFKWECPNCADVLEHECETIVEFAEALYTNDGVRYVKMKYMEGLFCSNCFNDTEVQNSSL